MRKPVSLLSAVLLIICFAAFAQAQDAPEVKCRALDALGNPIPKAQIQAWFFTSGSIEDSALASTDGEGVFMLPQKLAPPFGACLRLVHADYGTAETMFSQPFDGSVRFPLVKKGSDAEKNALRGIVLDPEDKPVAGARVEATGVRTPGSDGISVEGVLNQGCVYTDKAGRFRIHLILKPAAKATVVPDSTYFFTVIQESFALFPVAGNHKNSEEVVIHLPRPEMDHHFVFTGRDGEPLSDESVSRCVSPVMFRHKRGPYTDLPLRFRSGPVKLTPGRYEARYWDGQGGGFEYTAIEVTKDSPEELVFRHPPPATYSGRVVDGATGKPLAGAFVALIWGWRNSNLADLTAEQWQALRALQAAPAIEDHAIKPLQTEWAVSALARTDAEGRYAVKPPAGDQICAVVIFDEDHLPISIRGEALKADGPGRVVAPDAPLFPCARIQIKLALPDIATRLTFGSVSYDWKFEPDGQPDWLAPFQKCAQHGPAYIEMTHLLSSTPDQALLVPAGLRLRLEFYIPAEKGGKPLIHKYPGVLIFRPGETRKLDDLTVAPAP